MRKMQSFMLLEIAHDKPGIRYFSPGFTIGYQPKNPHWGDCDFHRKKFKYALLPWGTEFLSKAI